MSVSGIYPGGARFALTVVDDTDNATVENVGPIYDLLTSLGIRVTKTVWVYPPRDAFRGQCLQDPDYLEFVRKLKREGHEIGLHNVGSGAFRRDEILAGLESFRELLGDYPKLHANHVSNPDNLYWRPERRFRPPVSLAYALVRRIMRIALRRPLTGSNGDQEDSPYFWGDAARRHVRYVRNLTFNGLDTLAADPAMPYFDGRKPYVNAWFSSSDGHTVAHFTDLLEAGRLDRLEAAGGVSVVYTHFTDGFVRDGRVDPKFEARLRDLARRPGWFAPATEVLDWLAARTARPAASAGYLRRLEMRWLFERMGNYLRYRR